MTHSSKSPSKAAAGQRIELRALDDLKKLAEATASRILSSQGPQLILLDGPMGAGKTQFTSFFVKACGGDAVASPSYAFHHVYESPVLEIDHFDLYRLNDLDDLESIGFWDTCAHSRCLIIEWSEKLSEFAIDESDFRRFQTHALKFSYDSATGARSVTIL